MNFATMLMGAPAVVRKPRRVGLASIFAKVGGKATAKVLIEMSGVSKQAVSAALLRMEEAGRVRRAGTILRPGKGRSQTVWEWVQ